MGGRGGGKREAGINSCVCGGWGKGVMFESGGRIALNYFETSTLFWAQPGTCAATLRT